MSEAGLFDELLPLVALVWQNKDFLSRTLVDLVVLVLRENKDFPSRTLVDRGAGQVSGLLGEGGAQQYCLLACWHWESLSLNLLSSCSLLTCSPCQRGGTWRRTGGNAIAETLLIFDRDPRRGARETALIGSDNNATAPQSALPPGAGVTKRGRELSMRRCLGSC